VIALEIVSQVLPDHTNVTELRIEGDKLRLTGVTRDAPPVGLIEQSQHFTSVRSSRRPLERHPTRAIASTSRRV
jgi:general secretion pathway protein L